jgi:hypothetical protein
MCSSCRSKTDNSTQPLDFTLKINLSLNDRQLAWILTSKYKLAETNEALHVKPINGRRFANETILGPVHEIYKKSASF